MRPFVLRTTAAAAALALAAAPAAAQTTTFDFADLLDAGYVNGQAIPVAYGSGGNLAVTNHSVVAFGNSGQASCGSINSSNSLQFYRAGYGTLPRAVYQCNDGGVAQWFFQPAEGYGVTINSLQLGSFVGGGGDNGPARAFTVRIFDANWNPLFTQAGSTTTGTGFTLVAPNVSSAGGLYLQIGTNWNVGMGNLGVTVAPTAVGVVPEPSTYALVGAGLLAVGAAARRRAATA